MEMEDYESVLVNCDFDVFGVDYRGCEIRLPNELFSEEDFRKDLFAMGKEEEEEEKVEEEVVVDLNLVEGVESSDSDSDPGTMVVISTFLDLFLCGSGDGDEEDVDDDGDDNSFEELNFAVHCFMGLEHEIEEAEGDKAGLDVFGAEKHQNKCVNEEGDPAFAFTLALDEVNFVVNSFMEPEHGIEEAEGDKAGLDVFGAEKHQNKCVNEEGDPAFAFTLALGYLGVQDLLSVEMVCKYLKDYVQNDPLLWRNIEVSNWDMTDDDLIRLSNRAQGSLSSLSIVQCLKITNRGVKQVLENNPRLTKLSVSACWSIRVGEVLEDLKVFNSVNRPGINRLRVGGVPGATKDNFNELKLLLGSNVNKAPAQYNPRYHCPDQLHLSLDDEREIDLDICPRCQRVGDVYDCPAESCKVKSPSLQKCRACTLCIDRCMQCGICLDGRLHTETFCTKFICSDCMGPLSNGMVTIFGVVQVKRI